MERFPDCDVTNIREHLRLHLGREIERQRVIEFRTFTVGDLIEQFNEAHALRL